jgi:ribosomal protein S18 acetylase RimI-like enzyme
MALNSHRQLLAYYTLASASVLLDQLPSTIQKKLPRYAAVPAVRMGRLAVDKSHRQKGLGSTLLADALTRACRSEITAFALIVDAKDHEAIQFYRHHGFMSLSHQGQSLFLPLASASGLVHSKRVGS